MNYCLNAHLKNHEKYPNMMLVDNEELEENETSQDHVDLNDDMIYGSIDGASCIKLIVDDSDTHSHDQNDKNHDNNDRLKSNTNNDDHHSIIRLASLNSFSIGDINFVDAPQ